MRRHCSLPSQGRQGMFVDSGKVVDSGRLVDLVVVVPDETFALWSSAHALVAGLVG